MTPLASANPVMRPLSRLGLGVTGPHASLAVAPTATVALVKAAIDLGVTLFDTGPMYGAGEGERRLGLALADASREAVFVSTKARTTPMRGDDGLGADPADRVRRSLDASLTRLGIDRVDALFLHGPAATHVAPALAALRRHGRARFVGVCGRGAELFAGLEGGADLLMAPVSDQRVLARAAACCVSVLAIETMRGAATAALPRSGADLWYLARTLRDRVSGAAPPRATGVAAALQMPAVASVLVQTTRLAHLRQNIEAACRAD